MLANLGLGALVITLLVSLYGIGAAVYGALKGKPNWVDSARNAMLLTFPLVTLVAYSIIALLVRNQYEVVYVSNVTSDSMPFYLKITALWGGQAGSLIFWSWLMSAFASAVMVRKWDRDREFLPWVIVVALVTLSFFVSLSIFFENPFARWWQTATGNIVAAVIQPAGSFLFHPANGNGLNPLLRHPGMIIHPPMLYLGFVSFVIPFSFAIAALITGRNDDRWIRITRRWTLIAWLFLSLGLVLGMWWAYDVLGWGGYWGWDPVEIAALMPWLLGTAFVHSVMIQEKRGMLKQWNMILIILTYDMVIFGTFLTRSGVLSSVHAFAQSAIGPAFFAFIGATFIISMWLLMKRWNSLKAEGEMTSMLSREALFLLNNLLFMGIFVVCLWGVLFPLISEAAGFIGTAIPSLSHIFTGQKVTVGPSFYKPATGPLWGGILLLMGIAPLSAWRASTGRTLGRGIWKPAVLSILVTVVLIALGMRSWPALFAFFLCALVISVTLYEFWRGAMARHRTTNEPLPIALWNLAGRNRRRYGGYIIHLGVVLMAFGIIGIEMFQKQTQGSIAKGQTLSLGRYTVEYQDLKIFNYGSDMQVARAELALYKDGNYIGELNPRMDYYFESQQQMTIPGVRGNLEDDFYVILVAWEPITSQGATFKIFHNPLVNWLWLGAFVFIIGTMVAAWPDKETEYAVQRTRRSPAQTIRA